MVASKGNKRAAVAAISVIGLELLLALAVAPSLQAQAGTAGSFLRMGLGARAKAMGDAYSAVTRGLESSFYNPAGLPFLPGKEIILSYRVLDLDRRFAYVAFGTPVQPKIAGSKRDAIKGGLALSWVNAGVSNIDGRDTDGRHFDTLSNSENAFTLSFALQPSKLLALGLSLKVIVNRLPSIGLDDKTISANAVGFDFGALFTPVDWISLALVLKDFNTKYKWNTDGVYGERGTSSTNPFPKVLRTAAAVRIPRLSWITLALDYETFFREKHFKNKLDDRIHLGAEGRFKRDIVLRSGFDDSAITFGAGYTFDLFSKRAQLNYAFATPGDRAEGEHVFTWVFQL